MDFENTLSMTSFCSVDVEQYIEALSDWNLEFNQLSKGRGISASYSINGHNFSYLKFTHSKSAEQKALAEQPGLSFFVPAASSKSILLMGKRVSENVLCCTPQHHEIHVVTPDNFLGYTLSVDYELIEHIASRTMGLVGFQIPTQTSLYPMPSFVADFLRENLELIHCASEVWGGINKKGLIENLLEHIVIPLLLRSMCNGFLKYGEPDEIRDIRYLSSALSIVNNSLDAPPSIMALAQGQGVSARSLQNIFKRHLGLTPKEYINTLRLNKVRQSLSAMPVKKGVIADVANMYGFWHMGQFSKDYKALFHELPSETLRKKSLAAS